MTENKAIEIIEKAVEESNKAIIKLTNIKDMAEREQEYGEYYAILENCLKEIEACEIAIKALTDIQEYRILEKRLFDMFGGELPLFKYIDELEIALKEPNNPHPINARILTYEDSNMWEKYKKIGTPKECRIAMEKTKAVEATKINDNNFEYQCPKCHFKLEIGYKYCISCGQLLKYSKD